MKGAPGDKEGLHALAARLGEVEGYANGNGEHANDADIINPDKGVLHKARRFLELLLEGCEDFRSYRV